MNASAKKAARQAITDARKLLKEVGWTQGAYVRRAAPDSETPGAPIALCALGALRMATGRLSKITGDNISSFSEDQRVAYHNAVGVVESLLLEGAGGYIPTFNDFIAKDVGDVNRLFNAALKKLTPKKRRTK